MVNRLPAHMILGVILALQPAATPGLANDLSDDTLKVRESDDRSASLTSDRQDLDIRFVIDDAARRHASTSMKAIPNENSSDDPLLSSGSLFGGVLFVGLLILAAINGRKRPMRPTKNQRLRD